MIFENKKLIRRLDKMLEDGINGTFEESDYDETQLSKMETKWLRYLTTSKRSAQKTEQERRKLKELVSDISHQTKTPIANILLYTQLLQEQALDEQSRQFVNEIQQQSEKLDFLIQSLVKNAKSWLFSALVPGILIVLGAVLYFFIFPNEYSGIFQYGELFGAKEETIVVKSPLLFIFVCIVVAALMIPIQLLELGEEIGWRGYLLGFQIEKYGKRKAVLINGIEWGLAHLPLIYFGFNYSLNNPGAPYTNMALMVVVCVIMGIMFSDITIRTGNCMYAAIMHGVVNVIGEIPVYLTYDLESGLLGPNPTGILTISFCAVFSILLFMKLKD